MTFLSDLGRIRVKRHYLSRDRGKVFRKEFLKSRGMLWIVAVKRILVNLTFPGLFGMG
jgi:hypothetical protein